MATIFVGPNHTVVVRVAFAAATYGKYCCVNCLYLSNAKHCTLSALDTACVCFKVSISAVFCLDILQLYPIGLSFA